MPGVDLKVCNDLVPRASQGDARAARKLVEHLWPVWLGLVRRSRTMAAFAKSDDHVHNVATRMLEKIGRADGRGLRLYGPWREAHRDKTFEDWIRIVTANTVRDYVREQLGDTADRSQPSAKRLLNEFAASPLPEQLGYRPPITAAQTARQLAEFAATRLPEGQVQALRLWLQGSAFEEIDERLQAPAGQGRKLVRAAVAALRRHFAPVA